MHNMAFNHLRGSKKIAAYEVTLKDKKQIAEGTMAFVFEKPRGFHFRAGQHVRITLLNPPETDMKGNSRFLSLASTPIDKDLVVAMRMTDSAFKRVLERMPTGDKVLMQLRVDKMHRSFTLHNNLSIPAVFLIGGIGIVPAFSMIKDATERKLPHEIFLFYSNRRPEDAPFLDELQRLAKRNPNFTLVATMTQPERSTRKRYGETGFINQAMLKKYIDDLDLPIYYIAGLSGMVNAMKGLLKDLGVNKDSIRAEDFSDFKMHIMTVSPSTFKKHFALLAIILMIILGFIAQAGVAAPMLNVFSLQNLSYFTIGLILAIVLLKLLVIFKFKHHLGGNK